MKKIWRVTLLICLLFSLWGRGGGIGCPQEDDSMARVQRLLMASVFELPAEQSLEDSSATGYWDFPAYKKFLQEAPNANYTYQILLPFVCKIDGSNMRSTGDADMLRLTREFLATRVEKPDWQSAAYALLYLSQKSDFSDLPLLEKYVTFPSELNFAKQAAQESLRILRSRISGTNILSVLQTRYYCWSTNSPPFLPSVANTGPQAVYAYDLLKQALEKYGSPTNIPPEIVAVTVTLDAEGKPAYSIDPVKYGLKTPLYAAKATSLSTPQQQAGEGGKAVIDQLAPPCTEEQKEMSEVDSRPFAGGRVWLFFIGVAVFTALILFRFRRR